MILGEASLTELPLGATFLPVLPPGLPAPPEGKLYVVGDAGVIAVPPKTIFGGSALIDGDCFDISRIGEVAPVSAPRPTIPRLLPDLYEYYPEIVRRMDEEVVDRPDVPLHLWDGPIRWDEEEITWDDVIGPEPLLKATTRIQQIELDRCAFAIEELRTLSDLDLVKKSLLPYHAGFLGTPLPSAPPRAQRAFLKSLVDTYRNKGTPLSFFRLFESLGFTLGLEEGYIRRRDGSKVRGPQMTLVSSFSVLREEIGEVALSAGPYTFQARRSPLVRASVRVRVHRDSSISTWTFRDDGRGGWSGGVTGTIDYVSGVGTFTLPSSPSVSGDLIEMDYDFLPDPFPDPYERRWTNLRRGSSMRVSLTPKNLQNALTPEQNERLLFYLDLLKPAHVEVEGLDVIFRFEDDEGQNLGDDVSPDMVYLFSEGVFNTQYMGYGWTARENASINPDPFVSGIHRSGPEHEVRWDGLPDPTRERLPPYVFPVKMNGLFSGFRSTWYEATGLATGLNTEPFDIQALGFPATLDLDVASIPTQTLTLLAADFASPSAATALEIAAAFNRQAKGVHASRSAGKVVLREWSGASGEDAKIVIKNTGTLQATLGFSTTSIYNAPLLKTTVTADRALEIDRFSAAIGVVLNDPPKAGDTVAFTTGPNGGEARQISVVFNFGYLDITVTPPFPKAPTVGDALTILGEELPHMGSLQSDAKPQDALEATVTEIAGTGTGSQLSFGHFTSQRPVLENTVTIGFTIATVGYTETDDGAGGFSDAGGNIDSATIDYDSGTFTILFDPGKAPDSGTDITVTYDAPLGKY